MTFAWIAAAVPDCEAFVSGWPRQPVNAWSSLAFVAAAGLIFRRGPASARVAPVVALVGVGSLLYHGDDGAVTAWLHDWPIATLLIVLLVPSPGRRDVAAAVAAPAILLALLPGAAEWVQGSLAIVLAVRELARRRERVRSLHAAAAGLAASGAAFTILGRTGGSWCDPDSVLQPHAAWHVLAAGALVAYLASRRWFTSSTYGAGATG